MLHLSLFFHQLLRFNLKPYVSQNDRAPPVTPKGASHAIAARPGPRIVSPQPRGEAPEIAPDTQSAIVRPELRDLDPLTPDDLDDCGR